MQTLYRQLHDPPPPLAKVLPDAPAALDVLLDKALQKDPAQRFSSMRVMAVALAEVDATARRAAASAEPAGVRGDHSGRVILTAQRLFDEVRRARTRATLTWGTVALLVAVVLGGLVLLQRDRGQATRRELLVVTSQPPGARVSIDGHALDETTPTATRGLIPGKHEVTIAKEGYAAVTRSFTVGDGERQAIEVTLSPESRRLEVQTAPDGASLYVDGRLVPGTTPTTIALTVDDFHELRAERDGYETAVRALKPEEREPTLLLTLSPERHPRGTLIVESRDVADVWLDGVATGQTTPTIGFHVPVGDHVLELRTASGDRSAPKKVHVERGATLRLTMALQAGKP